jgi:hypothetical protein
MFLNVALMMIPLNGVAVKLRKHKTDGTALFIFSSLGGALGGRLEISPFSLFKQISPRLGNGIFWI